MEHMDVSAAQRFISHTWDESIVPALCEYIAIPNQSPAFDPQWREHGHMARAVDLVASWMRSRNIAGMRLEVLHLDGRTPLIFAEVPGRGTETVLLYGHLDKQPPMQGWSEGLGPWQPAIRGGRLYGRGGADDGYSAFASLTALHALREQNLPHARCVILIEAGEESGSPDLPAQIDALADRIGRPSLVLCLDSGCGNYEQLWLTTSLRGLVTGNLVVSTLTEGVHSGAAGGVVPSTFRIARRLLSRIEDESSGEILLPELHVEIPAERRAQAQATAAALGAAVYESYPFQKGARPVDSDGAELLLNRTWRPALEITGASGLPALESAGNVLRPQTALKLSLRLPPTRDAARATALLKEVLERDPPYGARVRFEAEQGATGWNAPVLAEWLVQSVEAASREFFGRPTGYHGEGGTIPFMAMLGERFPHAQFVITGVLGPGSNAHGPNEFLDLATGAKLTGCVARILADHYRAERG
jgi:acetylornithine deacetylase/succinyl-diaminopimelate desuccinylase-like protein